MGHFYYLQTVLICSTPICQYSPNNARRFPRLSCKETTKLITSFFLRNNVFKIMSFSTKYISFYFWRYCTHYMYKVYFKCTFYVQIKIVMSDLIQRCGMSTCTEIWFLRDCSLSDCVGLHTFIHLHMQLLYLSF